MKLVGITYFTIGYFILYYLVFVISAFKIFEKEGYNPLFSLIPGLNFWIYLKVCNLPVWTLLVPGVNIIVIFFSTYCLTYQYRFNRVICMTSIFLPIIFLPIIAFSKRQNINTVYDQSYVKSISDIDKIENSLIDKLQDNVTINNDSIIETGLIKEHTDLLEQIDNTNFEEQLIYDDDTIVQENVIQKNEEVTDIIELDDIEISDLSINKLDEFEDNIISSNNIEQKISQNLEEYSNTNISNETIAFGGKNQIENINGVQAKNDELKCSRCGSSLVGSNGYCPGCGLKL